MLWQAFSSWQQRGESLSWVFMDTASEVSPTAAVEIDSETVRRIREEKRLTQLYVAKVVGVTTDTVSRWENNRYPTIRRDNALKLAEALDVDPEVILMPTGDEASEPLATVAEGWWTLHRKMLAGAALVLVIGILLMLFRFWPGNAPVLTAQRILPPYAAPGARILIKLELQSTAPLKSMILREVLPVGWTLIEAQPAVSGYAPESGVVRWIFRRPALHTTVYYLLQVPVDAKQPPEFSGEIVANPDGRGTSVALESTRLPAIEPLHWADTNGNRIIEDLEILDVSDLTEEVDEDALEWDLIEDLWEAEGYRWQPEQQRFVPEPSP